MGKHSREKDRLAEDQEKTSVGERKLAERKPKKTSSYWRQREWKRSWKKMGNRKGKNVKSVGVKAFMEGVCSNKVQKVHCKDGERLA